MPVPPPIPTTPERQSKAAVPSIPFHHLLYGLFFHPAILVVLQGSSWKRAFRQVVLLCLFCGGLIGLTQAPVLMDTADDWGSWLERELGSVDWRDGMLHWQRPEKLPHTTRHRGWRIDFAPASATFPEEPFSGPERTGIWVTPSQIRFWERDNTSDMRAVILMQDGKILEHFDIDNLYPDGLSLKGDALRLEARRLMRHALPVVIIQGALEMVIQIMVYVLLFAAMPVLLRSPIAAGGFARLFTFYLYASIPPLIVATVYGCLHLPFLNTVTIFVVAFVAYLFLSARHLQKAFGLNSKG